MADGTLLLVLGAALAFVFGWNNSSYLIGNGQGSGALTLSESLLTSSAGLLLGVLILGPKMMKSLSGDITPSAGDQVVLVGLVVALLLTVSLSIVKLPVSFSSVVVGGFAGAVFGSALPLNGPRLGEITLFWAVSPIGAAALAYVLYKVIVAEMAGRSILGLDRFSRFGVIVTSVIVAFVLGANNIGLIYGTALNGGSPSVLDPILFTVIAIVGMVVLGRTGVAATVGDRLLDLSPLGVVATFVSSALLMLLGTELGLPISIGQCLLGGMVGAAFTKKVTVINRKIAFESVAFWAIGPLAAFGIAYLLTQV
jgi:inorganic phosphate transporter, PiT family